MKLQSKVLKSVDYNDKKRVMTLKFKSGKVYEYNSVPVEVFANLLLAKSPGKYFNQAITGKYNTSEIIVTKRSV